MSQVGGWRVAAQGAQKAFGERPSASILFRETNLSETKEATVTQTKHPYRCKWCGNRQLLATNGEAVVRARGKDNPQSCIKCAQFVQPTLWCLEEADDETG